MARTATGITLSGSEDQRQLRVLDLHLHLVPTVRDVSVRNVGFDLVTRAVELRITARPVDELPDVIMINLADRVGCQFVCHHSPQCCEIVTSASMGIVIL